MKLGIKVIYTHSNISDGPVFNNNETLACHAGDVRPYLRAVFPTRQELAAAGLNPNCSLDESERSVVFARFFGTAGYLLAIVKARSAEVGEPYDNITVWVHFPAKIDITGEQTLQVIEEIFDTISDPDNINANHLQAIAASDYPELQSLIAPISSSGDRIGVMEYGGDTDLRLADILGPELRQPTYTAHEGIFMLDRADRIAISSPELLISSLPQPIVTIPVPAETLGFKPFIGGMPFDRPVQVTIGQAIVVTWKRQGYKDILIEVDTTLKPIDPKNYSLTPDMLVVALRRDRFIIVDQRKHAILDAAITINGKALGEVMEIPESSIACGLSISVSRHGFATSTAKLTSLPDHIKFTLTKKLRHYEFALPVYDRKGRELPEKMKVTVESRDPLTRSPFRGFDLVNETIVEGEGYYKTNALRRNDNSSRTKILYFIAGAVVAAVIFAIVSWWNSPSESKSNRAEPTFSSTTVMTTPVATAVNEAVEAAETVTEVRNEPQKLESAKTEVPASSAEDLAKAMAYLNSKWTWNYEDLEKFSSTKGLYDDMNNFNLKRLSEYWSPKFPDCTKFQNVMAEVNNAIKRGFDPKKGHPDATFVKGHKGIYLEDYRQHMMKRSPSKSKLKTEDKAADTTQPAPASEE